MIEFFTLNYYWIVPLIAAILEAILRFVPSKYNLSILDTVYKIVIFFFPPNKKTVNGQFGGSHTPKIK